MRLVSIHTYPVKSCRRVDHPAAEVEPWGLVGDRRWLVAEPDGTCVTQRDEPRLALVRVTPAGRDGLVLRTPGAPDLDVPAPVDGARLSVRVFRAEVPATGAGTAADDWLSKVFDRPLRLVHLDDPTRRPVDPAYGQPGDRVSFADAYPVLAANAASLDAVNDWLVAGGDEPVPMTRFRPNLVVGDAPAWAEDDWLGRRVRVGAVTFRAVKPCDRCIVTLVDQDSAARGRQPLRVLRKHRRSPVGPLFGVNLIPDGSGPVAVGDPVEVC